MDKVGCVHYPGNTMNTTRFVKVTNDVMQIVHVETCEWGILYNEFV